MRKVFSNEFYEKAIEEKGWIKTTLLDQQQVEGLIAFYHERSHFQRRPGLHFSLASDNYLFRKEVNDEIVRLLSPKIQPVFDQYRMLYGNFMIKEPGSEGDFPLHQDWTYVDEPCFRSIAIWVALTDNDEQTGCLQLIEGSHLWGDNPRGPGLSWKFENVKTPLKKLLKPVPLRAGEALIWDHRLIHASYPNISAQPRLAATVICLPQEVQAFHYTKQFEPKESICKWQVNEDFFLRYTMQNLSALEVPLVETLPVHHQPISENELFALVNAPVL